MTSLAFLNLQFTKNFKLIIHKVFVKIASSEEVSPKGLEFWRPRSRSWRRRQGSCYPPTWSSGLAGACPFSTGRSAESIPRRSSSSTSSSQRGFSRRTGTERWRSSCLSPRIHFSTLSKPRYHLTISQ